jgi:hypothetical protein
MARTTVCTGQAARPAALLRRQLAAKKSHRAAATKQPECTADKGQAPAPAAPASSSAVTLELSGAADAFVFPPKQAKYRQQKDPTSFERKVYVVRD